MRIGIVADIHGNWTALQAVIPELERLQVDAVAGLGDYLWTTTGDQAVVDWITETRPGWFVRGNGDTMAYYERCKHLALQAPRSIYEAVSVLPERLVLDLEGYRVLLQHEWWPGNPDPYTTCERLRRPPGVSPAVDLTGIDVAIFGDSHLPHHYATVDTLIVHPGAVGAPFDADPTQAKFAVLDLGPDGVCLTHHAVPFDIHAANREIVAGRAVDINHSYYRKMTEIRLRITGEEYWAPVPEPVRWRPARLLTRRMIAVRSAWPDDVEAMLAVARTLPEWFNDHGIAEMTRDFACQQAAVAVAEEGGQERVVGFIAWAPSPHTPEPGLVELTWLGVDRARQGQGVGRRLVAVLEELCRAEGAHTIQVSTLADSVDYEPYAATRAFYRAVGFRDFRIDPNFYGEGDDRLLLRKTLS